jgi:hypothetical protein
MTPKEELLRNLDYEYKTFLDTVDGLDEAHLIEVWLGEWSVREIAAHLSGWHREIGAGLERMARGERPFPEGTTFNDVDDWNEKFASAARAMMASDMLRELEKSHAYFVHAASLISDDRYQPGKTAYGIVDGAGIHHYREHAEQIRAWRSSRGI